MGGLFAAGLTAVLLFTIGPTFALAADLGWNNGAPPKLVWRPVRPERTDSPVTKSVDDSLVRNATYEQDVFDDVPAPPKRIRLTAGASDTSTNATSDPFGDSVQSVQSRKMKSDAAKVEPEMIDTLPPPTREAPPTLQIDPTPTQREPAELMPPDPLRNGTLKRTIPTNQTEPFIPGPEAHARSTAAGAAHRARELQD